MTNMIQYMIDIPSIDSSTMIIYMFQIVSYQMTDFKCVERAVMNAISRLFSLVIVLSGFKKEYEAYKSHIELLKGQFRSTLFKNGSVLSAM